jgi:isopentenyl phosphate kinase
MQGPGLVVCSGGGSFGHGDNSNRKAAEGSSENSQENQNQSAFR